MIKNLAAGLSIYRPGYPKALVYMLQSSEYQVRPYLAWVWRTTDFRRVMRRRSLEPTKAARLLLLALRLGILTQLVAGLFIMYLGASHHVIGGLVFGAAVIIVYPLAWPYLLIAPLVLGRWFISGPSEQRAVRHSSGIFTSHPAAKIAVAGSYGKTTMKEILATVLGEGKKVAVTPANKNVSSSHAQFAKQLDGDEDVLVIEYGEGAPGDVVRFSRVTQPTHAVITGLAPAHLDRYKTLAAAGKDIFAVADYLHGHNVYVNADSSAVEPFLKDPYHRFDQHGALGWKVSGVKVGLEGTAFTLKKDKQSLRLHSGLVGRHQVSYLSLAAALGLELGLTAEQVTAGIAKTKPFEHRMQPYQLAGAWVVDDTYNGNLEGIRVGTQLLHDLTAKRKIYVTPGLVDQGEETERVHVEVGKLIAAAQPDLVVLMKNSVTDFIRRGLEQSKFKGEVRIEDQPLEFYSNLTHFVASGDLVVMQNDWTDNYA